MVGGLLAAATFVLLVIRGVSLPKAISYCSFFVVAIVGAELHWRISTDAPPVVVHALIYPTIIGVGIFSLIGFLSWASSKNSRRDKLLIAIIVLTIGYPVLWFGDFTGQFVTGQLLTWYVRFYVVICLAGPVVVLAQTWSKPREPHGYG